jgi:hypothetical protein
MHRLIAEQFDQPGTVIQKVTNTVVKYRLVTNTPICGRVEYDSTDGSAGCWMIGPSPDDLHRLRIFDMEGVLIESVTYPDGDRQVHVRGDMADRP